MELSKDYGFAHETDKDDLDFETKDDLDKEAKEKQEHFQLIKLLDRDEHARKLALEAGNKASNEALKQGIYTANQVAALAKEEMIRVLKEFRPTNVTVERGLDKAAKIRDLFITEENEREGIFTYEIEINDLQPLIRGKV